MINKENYNLQKMSKSLGNFTTIRELLERDVDPMAVRLFILQAQYRKPVDFTEEAIQAGLVDQMADEHQLIPVAKELAQQLANKEPEIFKTIKQTLFGGIAAPLATQ